MDREGSGMLAQRGPQPGAERATHGGKDTRDEYGAEGYRAWGKQGGAAAKERLGRGRVARVGKVGGGAGTTPERPEAW